LVGSERGEAGRTVRRVAQPSAKVAVLAGDAVDRHAGEAEQEHARAHENRALEEAAIAPGDLCVHQRRTPCSTKNSKKIATAMPPTIHAVRRMPARRWSGSKLACCWFMGCLLLTSFSLKRESILL